MNYGNGAINNPAWGCKPGYENYLVPCDRCNGLGWERQPAPGKLLKKITITCPKCGGGGQNWGVREIQLDPLAVRAHAFKFMHDLEEIL
jgi:hypothetical protein